MPLSHSPSSPPSPPSSPTMQPDDDEEALSVPLAPGGSSPSVVRRRGAGGGGPGAGAAGARAAGGAGALFRRAWALLPAAWGGERDAARALRSVRVLLGFGALCVFVFALPSILGAVAPEAADAPGSGPTLDAGASVIHGESGAVAADVGECSKVGVRVMRDLKGNAVDAAVAVVLCQGVLNPFASGLGGGAFLMVSFKGNATMKGRAEFLDAREVAPKETDPEVYKGNATASRLGGLAVGVPGELKGLEMAHARFGRVAWAELVRPVVEIAEAATVGPMLARRLVQMNETVLASPSLAAVYTREPRLGLLGVIGGDDDGVQAAVPASPPENRTEAGVEAAGVAGMIGRSLGGDDPIGGKEDLGSAISSPSPSPSALSDGLPEGTSKRVLLKEGDALRNPALVETLKQIAGHGSSYLYSAVADDIAAEVRAAGGVMKSNDLRHYRPVVRPPIESFYQGLRVLGGPPPCSGGASIAMALNILEGLQLHRHGRNGMTYRQLVETLKYVFAARMKLGDPGFVRGVPRVVRRMLSKRTAMTVRSWIADGDGKTYEPAHYTEDGIVRAAQREDGTTHISIVDKEDNAVAVTSTINLPFGAGFMSAKTGIVFNNEMDDFSTSPDRPNAFGLSSSPENRVVPGKRPLSSMSPTIILHNDLPYLVVGGSGGPRIITATLQAIVNVVDWGDVLGDALSAPRLHHQLEPNEARMESIVEDTCELHRALKRPSGTAPGGSWAYWPSVCKALKEAGHNVTGPSLVGCVQAVQAIAPRTNVARRVFAASDPRKIGLAAAY